MTRTRTRLAIVGIALLLVSSAVPLSPAVDTAAAAEHTFVVEQDGQCYEVSPLQSDEDVVSFYDYRAVEDTSRSGYSSYMPAHLQQEDVSRLFLYDGPDGVSLVIVHNANGGDGAGSAASFQFSGLPGSGDWVVEDDEYPGRDDDFARDNIDWTWNGYRSDGAAFRGLDREGIEVTVVPAFDEQADLYDEPIDRSGEVRAWQFLTGSVGDPGTVELDVDEPVTIRTGHCGPDETAPNAALSAEDGVAGFPVEFDASGSTDEGGSGIAAYHWDFDGDGEVEDTTEDPTVAHEFDSPDSYNATVTVEDGAGNTDRAQVRVAIETDDPPSAAFRVEDSPTRGFPVTFDARNATDDVDIDEYRWDFDGDGEVDRTTDDPRVDWTYDEAESREVELTVVDSGGNEATATRTVSVDEDDPPDPAIRVVSPETPVEGQQVVLDASDSTDDTGIDEYRWSFGGNATATGERVTYTFDGDGTHTVTLEVVDEGGNEATETVEIEVLPNDGTAPDADLEVGTNRTETGTEVEFDASGSTDEGGSGIAAYRWDFDGDGEVEDTTEDPTVSHAYPSNGTYDAAVTVVDGVGNLDTANVTVRVEQDRRPHRDEGDGGSSGGSKDGGDGDGDGGDAGDTDGDDGGASGGGSASFDPPSVVTETETRGPNAGLVDVRNGRAEKTIRAGLPASARAERTGVAFRSVRVDLASDDAHFVVETSRPTAGTADADLPADVTLGSLSVGAKYVESRQVSSVTYAVAIERSRLADAGLTPADLTAYHRVGDAWEQVDAAVASRGETVVLRVETDSFSSIAVGAERSVTVADVELGATQVAADEPVSVTATLRNEGTTAAEFVANLTADGEVVATKRVSVPAGATKQVTVEGPLAPGTHRIALGATRVGNVSVAEPTAAIGVADVSLNESTIATGEQVAVTATVENTGSEAGERTVALTLFGQQVATETVRVPAHATEQVTFVRTVNAAGNYTATVGNASASLAVTDEGGDDGRDAPGVPIPGFGVVATLAALVAALLVARKRR